MTFQIHCLPDILRTSPKTWRILTHYIILCAERCIFLCADTDNCAVVQKAFTSICTRVQIAYTDNCTRGSNSLTLKPLQRIQNAAARLVFNLPKCDCVTRYPVFPLAPCSSSYQIQDDGTGQCNCPCLPPSVGKTTHPSSSPPLNYFSWTSGSAIAYEQANVNNQSHKSSLFWHCRGGMSSLPMSGPQSRSPASAKTHLFRVHLDSS